MNKIKTMLILAASVVFAGLAIYASTVMFGFFGLIASFIATLAVAVYAISLLPVTDALTERTECVNSIEKEIPTFNPSAGVCNLLPYEHGGLFSMHEDD